MNAITEIRFKDLAGLDLHLLKAALDALEELTWAGDADIYTDAPECAAQVNRMEDAIQQAYVAMAQIRKAVTPAPSGTPDRELAARILEESEEAFGARSLAEERARGGECPLPETVEQYLFWIEEEAHLLKRLTWGNPDGEAEERLYQQALSDLSEELRGLGFLPAGAPCLALSEVGAEMR